MKRGYVSMSLVWFFCLAALGAFFPFISMYLGENAGLSGTEVGMVLCMVPLMGVVGQPIWGQIADRTGRRTRVLLVVILGAALGYTCLYFTSGVLPLMLVIGATAFFWTSVLPSSLAVTLGLVRDASRPAFGLIRVWGTIGFGLMVFAFPSLVDALESWRGLEASDAVSEPGLGLMFPLVTGLLLVAAVIAYKLPQTAALSVRAPRGDWRRLLRHGPFVRLLLFCFCAYLCLRGPMAFFALFVRSHGGSAELVSQMWMLMLVLEVPLIAFSGATLARFGARGLLAMGVIAGGLRWTVCAVAPDLSWIFPVQILHGIVIAGLMIGAPLYVEAVVPERLRAIGQGMLAMIGTSLGGVTSNFGAGWLSENLGANAPYLIGGLGALTLGCLTPLLLPAPRRAPRAADEE